MSLLKNGLHRIDNQIFWAILPNVVVGFLLLMLMQCQQDYESRIADRRKVEADLLSKASAAVVASYSQSSRPGEGIRSTEFVRDVKAFEAIYWGPLELIDVSSVEGCLTELHEALLAAVQGRQGSPEPGEALQQLQFKLAAIAHGFAKMEGSGNARIGTDSNDRHNGVDLDNACKS